MPNSLNISSVLLHNFEPNDLKIYFDNNIDFKTTDYDIINKYMIYKFNLYIVINNKDYNLQDCIKVNFKKVKVKYFDKFNDFI